MSSTDPIADMLTCIRNAVRIKRETVSVPSSKVKLAIAEALQREGFIQGLELAEGKVQNRIVMRLKYSRSGDPAISMIKRVSKPGRRVYVAKVDARPVLRGLGISVLSTPKGVLSDREARASNVGGELLFQVW